MTPQFDLHTGLFTPKTALLPPSPVASLERVALTLWRRRVCFVLVFLPVLALGLAYLVSVPERFTAHATLMVGFRAPELATVDAGRDPLRGEPDFDGAIELIRSQAALRGVAATLAAAGHPEYVTISSPPEPSRLGQLRQRTAALLGRGRPQVSMARTPAEEADAAAAKLRQGLKVDRVGRSSLLSVAFTATDPALAALAANAFAAFSANDESFLAQMTLAERAGFQIVKTSIVSSASVPEEPSAPNIFIIGGATLLLALGAAMSAALCAEYKAQQTVLSTEELTRRGLRALGVLPSYRAAEARGPAFHNSVGALQASLATLPRRDGIGGQVLLFTSALPAEGKSTTTAALAASMAASGKKVLVVDADLRSPTQQRIFGLALSRGLSDCLLPDLHPQELVQVDPATGVHVVTAGAPCPQPLEVLGSRQLCDMIAAWRTTYDVVLIDCPPVLAVGDVRLLASVADHVIVVARWSKTSWALLGQGMRMIAESGGHVAGVTVSRADVRALARYNYADARTYGAAP